MEAVLAVDIGTTNVKAGVFDTSATCLGLGSRRQEILAPHVGWREHEPAATWEAVQATITEAASAAGCAAAEVRAIAVAGPRGTAMLTAADGTPAGRMLTWQDRRAVEISQVFERDGPWMDAAEYYRVTGTPLDPSVVLARLLWCRMRDPNCLGGGRRLATPQADILRRLGAPEPVIDYSVAAHVGLLDVARLEWSTTLVNAFDIPLTLLPPVAPPGQIVGSLDSAVARDLGLTAGIPLVLAGSDGVCAELGAGVVDEGQLYGYLGTASTIAGPLERLKLEPAARLIVMPGSRHDRWRVLALAMAGGSALEWFGLAFGHPIYAELESMLRESPPGARGVHFIPTLAGAGAPFWDAAARGAFLGLSLSTQPADLARAVLEGVALEMRWMITALHGFGVAGQSLHLTGGGTRSNGWCQIVADATEVPVLRVGDPELGLRGAAFYALAGINVFPSALAAARTLSLSGDEFLPEARLRDRYARAAEVYQLTRGSFRETGIDQLLLTAGVTDATHGDRS